jgi:hypothetical protein
MMMGTVFFGSELASYVTNRRLCFISQSKEMTSDICQIRWCTYITKALNPVGNRVLATLSHIHLPSVRNDTTEQVRGIAKSYALQKYCHCNF